MEQNCASSAVRQLFPLELEPQREVATGAAVAKLVRVLLVEDEPEAANLVRIGLAEDVADAFHVEWCSTLVEAMHRLAMPGIDVILLDLGLPELNGYPSYRAIEAASRRHLPVVILTADDRINVREVILEFGASAYLVKGQNTSLQLRQALRSAVQRGGPLSTSPRSIDRWT